eukprot:1161809-Pelagomonas_calceolata.AAC.5
MSYAGDTYSWKCPGWDQTRNWKSFKSLAPKCPLYCISGWHSAEPYQTADFVQVEEDVNFAGLESYSKQPLYQGLKSTGGSKQLGGS